MTQTKHCRSCGSKEEKVDGVLSFLCSKCTHVYAVTGMTPSEHAIQRLKAFGFDEVEHDYDSIRFSDDGDRSILVMDAIKCSTPAEVIKESTLWSCCGDEVDEDFRLCPTCKEHV